MENLSEEERIIKDHGLEYAKKTSQFLMKQVKGTELSEPIRYVLGARQDYLHPSIISLSCEAAHGTSNGIQYISTAMSLACHSIAIFDDILDKTTNRRFVPTVPGRFGFDRALLVAGFIAAKAFGALDLLAEDMPITTFCEVSKEFQIFLSKMTFAEIKNSNVSKTQTLNVAARLDLLEAEAVDIEAAPRLGAIVGGCEADLVETMTIYGHHLGKALRLREDLDASQNLTLELKEKIKRGAIPYPIALALSKSDKTQQFLHPSDKKTSRNEWLNHVISQLFDAGAFDDTVELIDEEAQKSISSLKEIGESKAKHALTVLASCQKKLALQNFRPS